MASDFSELDSLVSDLRAAPTEVRPFVKKALQVTAHDIRNEWRSAAARRGLQAYGRSVGYDVTERATSLRAEIGPTPGRPQASFGFVEEANGGVRSAPQHAGRDALKANEPDYFEGIEIALADGLRKAVGG